MDRVSDRADLGDLGAELAPRAAARAAPADGHRTQRPRAGAQLSRMARTRLPQACRRSVLAAVTGVLCLVVASPAVAHQSHVVGDAARVAVSDPEISKAYYGRLPGVPARYEIVSRLTLSDHSRAVATGTSDDERRGAADSCRNQAALNTRLPVGGRSGCLSGQPRRLAQAAERRSAALMYFSPLD